MCGTPSSDQVCALNPSTANGLYATGCLDAVEESIVANAKIVGGIACGVILLMVRGRAVSNQLKSVSKLSPNSLQILNFGIATYMCCVIGTLPSESRAEKSRRRRHEGKNYGPAATVVKSAGRRSQVIVQS